MSLRSVVSSSLGTVLVFMTGMGCASESRPPCDAAAVSAKKAESSGGESASGVYYALPGTRPAPNHLITRRGITTEFDGNRYEFMQLHFHTPSEHLVDGITYPMEMHLVHSRPGLSSNDPPNYLVVALLFRMGKPNQFIEEFLDAIPTQEGRSAKLDGVFVEDVLGSGLDVESIDYFHYRGSLTTPPYTECVDWMVAKQIVEAGPAQIQRIHLVEGDNARHIQRLGGRAIDE